MKLEPIGRILILFGLGTSLLGGLVWTLGRFFPNLRIGRLPGDIAVEKPGVSFYFPITTMILLSVVLTLIMWIVGAIKK